MTNAWLSARFVRTFDPRDFGFQMIARALPGGSIERINADIGHDRGLKLFRWEDDFYTASTTFQHFAGTVTLPPAMVWAGPFVPTPPAPSGPATM